MGRVGGSASVKLSTAVSHLKMDRHRAALVGGLAGLAASSLQIEDCKVILDGALAEGSQAFGLAGSAPAASSAARVVVDDFLALSDSPRPAGAQISIQNVYLVSDRDAGGQYTGKLQNPRDREGYATFDFSWTWRVVTYSGVNATSESAFLQLSCPTGQLRVGRQCVYEVCISDIAQPVICNDDPALVCT